MYHHRRRRLFHLTASDLCGRRTAAPDISQDCVSTKPPVLIFCFPAAANAVEHSDTKPSGL